MAISSLFSPFLSRFLSINPEPKQTILYHFSRFKFTTFETKTNSQNWKTKYLLIKWGAQCLCMWNKINLALSSLFFTYFISFSISNRPRSQTGHFCIIVYIGKKLPPKNWMKYLLIKWVLQCLYIWNKIDWQFPVSFYHFYLIFYKQYTKRAIFVSFFPLQIYLYTRHKTYSQNCVKMDICL